MNWVGGIPSRHRRKEDIANQERYFARARSRRREKAETNPVALSAANFIPKYSAASNAAARVAGPSPLGAPKISKSSASLGHPAEIMQNEGAERPSPVVPPSQTSGSAALNNRSTKHHFIGTAGPEAEQKRFLKQHDFMQSKLPKLSIIKPAQERRCSAAARQVVGQQRRQSTTTSHRERGGRKRRLSQVTSPPVDTAIRIRVGSKSYQWSEAENSLRNPTYNSSSPSPSASESRCIASSTGDTSYVTGESLTGLSSPAPLLSPGSCRPAHGRRPSDSTKHISRAGSAKSQSPMTAYTDALPPPRPPAPKSTAGSTSSMAVEVGHGQESPKIAMDGEHIWRAWLNQDMPEFQVLKTPQDITAGMARPLPTPVPQGLATATLPIEAGRDSALQEPSAKSKRRFGVNTLHGHAFSKHIADRGEAPLQ
ncbi:hypothetical protein ACQKWADRAFT_173284 [Trichoderma austrokoningii]